MMKAKKTIILLSVIMGLLLIAFFVWSNGPSVATIKSQFVEVDVKGASIDEVSEKIVDYEQLTIQIPDRFVSKTRTEGTGKPLYIQQLFTVPVKDLNSLFSDQLAITIGIAPTSRLKDISDVQLRTRDESYSLTRSEEQLLIFEKTSTIFEIGAFIKHGNDYISLVFSGPGSDQERLRQELNKSIESIVWY